jgi:hypothetical protein
MPSAKKIDLKKLKATGEITAGLTRKENNEIMEYTRGFEVADHPQKRGVASFRYLKELSKDQLVSELIKVHVDATLKKWWILWELRQRFPSDTEFGQYIAELKSLPTGITVGGQQEVNRSLHAGKFCERHKINDLSEIGMAPSVIIELARPCYDGISDELYLEFRKDVEEGKSVKYKDVKRRLRETGVVLNIPGPEQTVVADFNGMSGDKQPSDDNLDERLLALADEDASMLPNEAAVREFLIFAKRFRRQDAELIKIFGDCINAIKISCG